MSSSRTAFLSALIWIVVAFSAPEVRAQVSISGNVTPSPAASPAWTINGSLTVGNTGTGALTLSAGGTVSNENGLVGSGAGSNGTVNVNGGTWTNSLDLVLAGSGRGTLNLSNGSVTNANCIIGFGGSSIGTATVSGGNWTHSGSLTLGQTANAQGTLNLNGGVVTAGQVSEGAGNGTVTFNGGTLRLNAAQSSLFDGLEGGDVSLSALGGTIDTQGFSVTATPGISGAGALKKQGSGTLILAGNNTYTGDTVLFEGKLAVTGSVGDNSSSIQVGAQSGANADLEISSGVVTASHITKGVGNGTVTLSGGTLRIGADQASLFSGFPTSAVNLVPGTSSTIDTQSFNVSTLAKFGSGGSLEKAGNGTLSLQRATSMTFHTLTVRAGTLILWSTVGYVEGRLIVGKASGDTGTFSVNGNLICDDIVIGMDAGSQGTLTAHFGTLRNDYLKIGQAGNGSLDVDAIAEIQSFSSVIGDSDGSIGTATVSGGSWRVSSRLTLAQDLGSTGTLNLFGGLVSVAQISEGAGTGAVTFDGGTLQLLGAQSALFSGFESGDVTLATAGGTLDTNGHSGTLSCELTGAGALTKVGSGTLSLSGSNTYQGGTRIRAGTLAITSSVNHSSADLIIGLSSGESGTLDISGSGSFRHAACVIAHDAGSTGVARISSGSLTSLSTLNVGNSGNGTLEISGSATVRNTTIGSIGSNPGSTSVVKVSGGSWTAGSAVFVGNAGNGTLEVSGTGLVRNSSGFIGMMSGSTGLAKVSSGTWTNSSTLFIGSTGQGTLEISGTGAVAGSPVLIASEGGSQGTANLLGGTLTATQVSEGSGNGTLTFNGGALRLSSNQASLFSGFEAGDVTLTGAGGTIHTQGFTVATSYGLSGSGALIKQGTGTLTLSGSHTYSGATTVAEGTLALVGGSHTSPITVQSGAFLAFTLGSPTTSSRTFNLSAGKIKISGTPTLPSYTLIASSAGIIGTPSLDSPINGYLLSVSGNSLKLVLAYDHWTSAHGLDNSDATRASDMNADSDGDGVKNLAEFAFGGHPRDASHHGHVHGLSSDTDANLSPEFILTLAVRQGTPPFSLAPGCVASRDGITYEIESSDDLVFGPGGVTEIPPVPPAGMPTPGPGYEWRSFRKNGSEGQNGRGFLRAKVTAP